MRLARTLTPGDRIATPYFEVPFEMKGGRSLEVLLEYDKSRAVIDLGCQGPRVERLVRRGQRTLRDHPR